MRHEVGPKAEQKRNALPSDLRLIWHTIVLPKILSNPYPRSGSHFDITDTWVRGNRVHSFSSDELPGKIVTYVVEPPDAYDDPTREIAGWIIIFDTDDEPGLKKP